MAHGQHDYEKIKNGKFFSFMLIGTFSILLSAVALLSYLISKIPQLGETGIWISIPISRFWQTPPELFITLPQKRKSPLGRTS